MNNSPIDSKTVNEVAKMNIEDIQAISEKLMDATHAGNKTIEEMENLRSSISSFHHMNEKYKTTLGYVRSAMRSLLNRM